MAAGRAHGRQTRALWTLWVILGKSYAAADEAVALRILAMPFLDEVSGANAAVLDALSRALSASRPLFDRILTHPLLAAGIADEQAVRVAALDPVVGEHPERVDAILDRKRTPVEMGSVRLSLTVVLSRRSRAARSASWPSSRASTRRSWGRPSR